MIVQVLVTLDVEPDRVARRFPDTDVSAERWALALVRRSVHTMADASLVCSNVASVELAS